MQVLFNGEAYIVKTGAGTKTVGGRHIRQMVDALRTTMGFPPTLHPDGSRDLYLDYEDLTQHFAQHPLSKHTWFSPGTESKAARVLQAAYDEERIVRVMLGDPETGRDWCAENDVVGFIGRSTGTFKSPLILEAFRTKKGGFESARYGDALPTANILRIIDAFDVKELYRHKRYEVPNISVKEASPDLRKSGYYFSAVRKDDDGKSDSTLANFRTDFEAEAYVAFMRGQRAVMGYRTSEQARQEELLAA